jgi:hypothetical protein
MSSCLSPALSNPHWREVGTCNEPFELLLHTINPASLVLEVALVRATPTVAATDYGEKDFDLVAFFDCLHDMADPAGAARHARGALKSDGSCMLVEPFAADEVSDNFNPVGRLYYGASSLVCVPVSLARNGPALGAQAAERRLREIMVDRGGFSTMRRATETPFNIVLEARP